MKSLSGKIYIKKTKVHFGFRFSYRFKILKWENLYRSKQKKHVLDNTTGGLFWLPSLVNKENAAVRL